MNISHMKSNKHIHAQDSAFYSCIGVQYTNNFYCMPKMNEVFFRVQY